MQTAWSWETGWMPWTHLNGCAKYGVATAAPPQPDSARGVFDVVATGCTGVDTPGADDAPMLLAVPAL